MLKTFLDRLSVSLQQQVIIVNIYVLMYDLVPMDEELYRQNILELYRHPRNKSEMVDADLIGKGINASCGDRIVFYIKLDGDKISDASFIGDGCAISMASASMLTDKIKGLATNELRSIAPGDIYNMLGVKINPWRTNCALLGYEAMNKAVKANAK